MDYHLLREIGRAYLHSLECAQLFIDTYNYFSQSNFENQKKVKKFSHLVSFFQIGNQSHEEL